MSDEVSSLSVTLSGRDVNLAALLRRIETELQKTDRSSQTTARGLGERLAQGEKRAGDEAIRTAQAIARLDAANGRAGQGVAVLTNALQNNANASQRVQLSAQTQLARLEQQAAGADRLSRALSGATSVAAQFGIALAVPAIAQGAVELARTGAEADLVRQRFDGLAAAAGTTGQALLDALRVASGGEISDLNLQLAANRAQLLGVADSAQEFATLMSIARDRAQQMGISTSQAFNDLVTGLGRGSALILDNLGITVSVTEANEAYAASIGKTVSQLSEEEKKIALINAVLVQGQASLTATGGAIDSDAAAFQRLGAQGENAANQIGLAISNVIVPGVKLLGDALAQVGQGFEVLNTLDTRINQTSGALISGSATFAEYAQRSKAAADELFALGGIVFPQLTEAQFQYAQSLIASGTSAEEAAAKAAALTQTFNQIAGLQRALAEDNTISAAASRDLVAGLQEIAIAGGPAGATALQLAEAYQRNTITAQELAAILPQLAAAQTFEANAAQFAASAYDSHTAAVKGSTSAVSAEAQALVDETSKKLESAQAAEQLAAFQASLAALGNQVAGGLATSADAAAILAQQYGIASSEAERLIKLQALLAQAKVNAQALADQRAGERGGGLSQQQVEDQRMAEHWEQVQARLTTTTRTGGRARVSEQAKAARDSENIELDHQNKLTEITQEGARRRQEADNAYRLASLRGAAGFYAGLANIEDQALARDLSARYEAAAQQASEIARTQGADAAQAYLEASRQAIEGEAQLRQQIADAEKDGDAGRAEYLRGVLKLTEAANAEELRQLQEKGSAIAAEQDKQFSDEQARYDEHLRKMAQKYQGVVAANPGFATSLGGAAAPTAPAPASTATSTTAETTGKGATLVSDPATQSAVEVGLGRVEGKLSEQSAQLESVIRRVGDVESAVRSLSRTGMGG